MPDFTELVARISELESRNAFMEREMESWRESETELEKRLTKMEKNFLALLRKFQKLQEGSGEGDEG